METMTEAIVLLDADGRAIGSNPAATRVFGLGWSILALLASTASAKLSMSTR